MNRVNKGFTIVEITIVIAVIGILSVLGLLSIQGVQNRSRDAERSSKITIISEYLEKYYSKNGEYPSCTAMSQSITDIATNTLIGISPSSLTTPTDSVNTNSILGSCADLTNGVDKFAYIGDGSTDCLTGSYCTKYTLKYYKSVDDAIATTNSRHAPNLTDAPTNPTISVALNGANILATITPVTCTIGTPQYGIRSRTNDGTWSSYSNWSTTMTSSQTANDGVKYGYQAQARCNLNDIQISSIATSSESIYIDPIATPSSPVIASPASTVDITTTWSWNNVACPAGTTARYQYDYLVDTISQAPAGWKTPNTPTATSIDFTTVIEGHTYTIKTQSQCYNSNISSAWSSTSNAVDYYRPISITPITAIAAINGTSQIGQTLAAGAVTPAGATVSYQWYSSATVGGVYDIIIGATASTYIISPNVMGKYVKVAVAGTGTYNGTQTSTATAQVPVDNTNWLAIGAQTWAKANLNVGTRVTGVTTQTNNATTEKYCYGDIESNCTTYGGLYQWDEAMNYSTAEGARGICPAGSHVPSDNDWKVLEVALGMTQSQADSTDWRGTDQGTKLKTGGASGLNIPLAGYRDAGGNFVFLDSYALPWSSTSSGTVAWLRDLDSTHVQIARGMNTKTNGFSIRCLGN